MVYLFKNYADVIFCDLHIMINIKNSVILLFLAGIIGIILAQTSIYV